MALVHASITLWGNKIICCQLTINTSCSVAPERLNLRVFSLPSRHTCTPLYIWIRFMADI